MQKQATKKTLRTMSHLMECPDRVLLSKTLCEQEWACSQKAILAFNCMCITKGPSIHPDIMLDYALSHLTPSWVMDYIRDFKIDNLDYYQRIAIFQWVKDKHEVSGEDLSCYARHIEYLLLTRTMPTAYFVALLEVSWPFSSNTSEKAFYHVRKHFKNTPLQILMSGDEKYMPVMSWVAKMVFSKNKTSPAVLLQKVPAHVQRYVIPHLSCM